MDLSSSLHSPLWWSRFNNGLNESLASIFPWRLVLCFQVLYQFYLLEQAVQNLVQLIISEVGNAVRWSHWYWVGIDINWSKSGWDLGCCSSWASCKIYSRECLPTLIGWLSQAILEKITSYISSDEIHRLWREEIVHRFFLWRRILPFLSPVKRTLTISIRVVPNIKSLTWRMRLIDVIKLENLHW